MSSMNLSGTLTRVSAWLRTPQTLALVCGGLAGIFLVSWLHPLTATFGVSQAMLVALLLSLALGCEWGWRQLSFFSVETGRPLRSLGLLLFVLAGWTVAFSWLLDAAIQMAGLFSLETLAEPLHGLMFQWAVALLLLGLPTALLMRIPWTLHALCRQANAPDRNHRKINDPLPASLARWYLSGIAVGLLVDVFVLAPRFGIQAAAMFASVCGAAGFLVCLERSYRRNEAGGLPESDNELLPDDASTRADASHADSAEVQSTYGIWAQLTILALGGLAALFGRIAHQLVPAVASLVFVEWTALLAGFVLGWAWSDRWHAAGKSRAALCAWSTLVAASSAALLLALFGRMVGVCLEANASISQTWLLTLFRSGVVAYIVLPVGTAWGCTVAHFADASAPVAARRKRRSTTAGTRVPPLRALTFAAGFICVRLILLPALGVTQLTIGTILVLTALAAVKAVSTRTFPAAWLANTVVAGALLAVVAGVFLSGAYQPARASRLLFSTNVFMAKQSGTSPDLLGVLDEGRPVTVVEGDRGTYTLWKYRGVQFQLRESGVPKGVVSTNTDACPHYSAEVLTAALPLTLHESPRRVLLLGLGGGTPLTTCLDFPVEKLTCADADSRLFRLLDDVVWPASGLDPMSDDRLRCWRIDPALAVACRAGAYEVIISNPDHSALAQSTPHFTRQFYGRVARSLADDGIFCQRFQQIDYGPEPLRSLVHGLKAAFHEVVALETAPGEMVLLATNAPQGIVRTGLADRFQRPHVRWTLSRLGWDWTVPLNLAAFADDALGEIAAQGSAAANTAANGRFAFRLPGEMMRWGAKWQERQAALSEHARRFLEWDNVDGNSPVILRRLGEVTRQRRLIARTTDQPWSYRKLLREQIQKRPRSAIERVAFQPDEGRLHPEDERRIDYLEALGEAARQRNPRGEQIEKLAEFALPYDPIISFFVHYEIAELYARSPDHNRRTELTHRLHTVYFVDGNDRSVRNVVAALNLLLTHPEAAAGPLQRWDHLNALTQVLKARWEARHDASTTSTRILLNDVDKCVSTLESSLAEMDRLQAQLELPESSWKARRKYVEQSIVRPLRTYRTRLLPHHLRQTAKEREAAGKSASADADENTDAIPAELLP